MRRFALVGFHFNGRANTLRSALLLSLLPESDRASFQPPQEFAEQHCTAAAQNDPRHRLPKQRVSELIELGGRHGTEP